MSLDVTPGDPGHNSFECPTVNCVECMKLRIAYLEAQESLLQTWQDKADRLEHEISEVKRPLDAEMARLNRNLIAANKRADFQKRVDSWVQVCFGTVRAKDRTERNHRFLEEALELVQACGCTIYEAHQLVDYVFNRPVGSPLQEAGGTMTTLAALCLANQLDMHEAGEIELKRIWTKLDAIRAKADAKPRHSPLPQ